MDNDPITRSTMILADSVREAKAAAGPRSADPSPEPGQDSPPGSDGAYSAAETVARLIRDMIDACGDDELSRLEDLDLEPTAAERALDAADLSHFESPGFATSAL